MKTCGKVLVSKVKISFIRTVTECTLHALQVQALSFTFTLAFEDGDEDCDGLRLSQFGMHEIVDDVALFSLRLPRPSSYRFIVYARDSDLEVSALCYVQRYFSKHGVAQKHNKLNQINERSKQT